MKKHTILSFLLSICLTAGTLGFVSGCIDVDNLPESTSSITEPNDSSSILDSEDSSSSVDIEDSSSSGGGEVETPVEPEYNWDDDGALKILMIGNSWSDDTIEHVGSIATSLGVEKVILGNLFIGGCSLDTHYENLAGDYPAYAYRTNVDGTWQNTPSVKISTAVKSENWDFISLQQGSGPSGLAESYSKIDDAFAILKTLASENTKFVWNMTWAYQNGATRAEFAQYYGSNQMTMYNMIVSVLRSQVSTKDYISIISPTGTAIQNARTSFIGDNLGRDSVTHLSLGLGRYIAGLTFLHALTGIEFTDDIFVPTGVNAEEKAAALESAINAVKNPFEVTQSKYTLDSSTENVPDGAMLKDYSVVCGKFGHVSMTETKSASVNALAIHSSDEFKYGSLEIDMNIPQSVTTGDHGIVFALTEGTSSTYWEGNGSSYYFFFIDANSNARLGKTGTSSTGAPTWSNCGEKPITGFTRGLNHTLKVEYNGSRIKCYVDGELYINFVDNAGLTGTKYGFRSGLANIVYSNVNCQSTDVPPSLGDVTEDQIPEDAMIKDYQTVSGKFSHVEGNKVISTSGNSLAIHKTDVFEYGTLEMDMLIPETLTSGDHGIVFGLTKASSETFWESGSSYYFFFIDSNNNARLGKVSANPAWTNCAEARIVGFTRGITHTLKVVNDGTTLECYVDGIHYLTYSDNAPLTGKCYGLRAGLEGIEYGNVKCSSSSTPPEEIEASEWTAISGKLVELAEGKVRAKGATTAIHKTLTFTEGTLKIRVAPIQSGVASVIFGANEDGSSYYSFGINGRNAEFAKVVGGVKTIVQKGVLSAGYGSSNEYQLEIIKNGNAINCYFHLIDGYNRICYASYIDENALSGDKVGVVTAGGGTVFTAPAVTEEKVAHTAETLLFGHSYMELWNLNYKSDFPEYASIDTIGIGGSIASHWTEMVAQTASYNFKLGIFMIGINGLTGNVSPQSIANDAEETLLAIHALLPEAKFVLVGVNHCPARQDGEYPTITTRISQTNELFKNIAAQYDWINFAECEYLFCSTDGVASSVDGSYFSDRLHLNAGGYDMLAEVIKNAIAGEGQPSLDPDLTAKQLKEAKDNLISSFSIYSEYAFTAENWALAKPHYDAVIEKINACATKEEVLALDLSSERETLDAITNKAEGVSDKILCGDIVPSTGISAWSKVDDKTVAMTGYTYSLTNSIYADSEVVFRLYDNGADVGTAGVLLRASKTANGGINAYLINYVTKENYIQVYWLFDQYGGTNPQLKYIGGIVYNGEVENVDFYGKIAGNILYVCSFADYIEKGISSAVAIDLAETGKSVWENGSMGVLSWTDASFKLNISKFAGTVIENSPDQGEDGEPFVPGDIAKDEAVENAGALTDAFIAEVDGAYGTGANWEKTQNGAIKTQGNGWIVDESKIYSDTEAVLKVGAYSELKGNIGWLFRSSAVSFTANSGVQGRGVNGYFINYAPRLNVVYVCYLNQYYNFAGLQPSKLATLATISWSTYDSDLYVKFEGSKCYVVAYSDYLENGLKNATVVDLTMDVNGNSYALYDQGSIGMVSFVAASVTWELTTSRFVGLLVETQNPDEGGGEGGETTDPDEGEETFVPGDIAKDEAVENAGSTVDILIGSEATKLGTGSTWTKTESGAISSNGNGWTVDESKIYTDSEAVISAANPSEVKGYIGLTFRTTVTHFTANSGVQGTGLDGYFVAFVPKNKVIEVHYMHNFYNFAGLQPSQLTAVARITWEDPSVETYVKFEGNKCYIVAYSDYLENGLTNATEIDLTKSLNGAALSVYEQGSVGEISFNGKVWELTFSRFVGKEVAISTEE